MICSIDPGKHGIAWARFDWEGRLQACSFVSADGGLAALRARLQVELEQMRVERVVVEVPQIYQQRMWKGDPNDLVDVAVSGGIALGFLKSDAVELVRPRRWKGTRPKDVCNALTLATLTDHERTIVDAVDAPPYLMHNVLDAVGIGLWKVGRR